MPRRRLDALLLGVYDVVGAERRLTALLLWVDNVDGEVGRVGEGGE